MLAQGIRPPTGQYKIAASKLNIRSSVNFYRNANNIVKTLRQGNTVSVIGSRRLRSGDWALQVAGGGWIKFGLTHTGGDRQPFVNLLPTSRDRTRTVLVRPRLVPKKVSRAEVKRLKKWYKGKNIENIQRMLQNNGYNIGRYGADGVIGKQTIVAIKAFQANNNLGVDGKVGTDTLRKLQGGGRREMPRRRQIVRRSTEPRARQIIRVSSRKEGATRSAESARSVGSQSPPQVREIITGAPGFEAPSPHASLRGSTQLQPAEVPEGSRPSVALAPAALKIRRLRRTLAAQRRSLKNYLKETLQNPPQKIPKKLA